MHLNNSLLAFINNYAYIYILLLCTNTIYVSRHGINKILWGKINKSYIQKVRCFIMHCSMDTNCLGIIIIIIQE